MILNGTGNSRTIAKSYESTDGGTEGGNKAIRRMVDPVINQKIVYDELKEAGYYDLTIERMIKHISDKSAAHSDTGKNTWISIENGSTDPGQSAVSAFATQMIYAATKQIDELKGYWTVEPLLEIL